mmetsp:Transcript_89623/g.149015  ORF Transcript_89623/g.149015 Transcript_89623/m.149015 type:complete len:313 (-) Transcript_89623:324-1262(-)
MIPALVSTSSRPRSKATSPAGQYSAGAGGSQGARKAGRGRRKEKAAFHSRGPALMGPSKWQGITRRKSQPPTRSAHARTASGTFSYSSVPTTGATSSRPCSARHRSDGSSRFCTPKNRAVTALRRHPSRSSSSRDMSLDRTGSAAALSRASYKLTSFSTDSVRLSSSALSRRSRSVITSGAVSEMRTTASVTRSVLVATWSSTVSLKQSDSPTPMGGGRSVAILNSSAHGIPAPSSPSMNPAGKMPKACGGRSTGQLHCPPTGHTAALGNARLNGPTKILCSKSVVGSTMCSTGSPSSLTRATHSPVGAMGA